MKMLLLCSLLLAQAVSVTAYPQGPPEGACKNMFPVGHESDAKNFADGNPDPPYELVVTSGHLGRGHSSTLTLTLRVKSNSPGSYFQGMFVQARMADCEFDKPIGTFSFTSNTDYLKLMDCEERTDSAISHKKKQQMTSVEFFWNAAGYPGHIYFRATVVKDRTTFWTNVFSDIIRDDSDDRPHDVAPCEICQSQQACIASSFTAMTSLIVAAFGLSLFWQ